MTHNMPSGVKKHHESTKPESCQTAKIDGFRTNQQHFTPNSVLTRHFFTTLKSHKAVRTSH